VVRLSAPVFMAHRASHRFHARRAIRPLTSSAKAPVVHLIWHSGACHGQSGPEDNLSINHHASRWISPLAVYLRLCVSVCLSFLSSARSSCCKSMSQTFSMVIFCVSVSVSGSLSLYICFYLCLCLCLCLYQALDLFLYLSPVTHSFLFSSMWLVRNNVEKNVDVHLVLSEVLLTLTWSDSRHDNVVT